MKTTIKLIIVLLGFILISCESTHTITDSNDPLLDHEVKKLPLKVSKRSAEAGLVVTGKSVYINYADSKTALSEKTKLKIMKILKKDLKNYGYAITRSMKNAHVTLYVVVRTSTETATYRESKTTLINGKLTHQIESELPILPASIQLQTNVNTYGQRPKLMGSLVIRSPTNTWKLYEDQLLNYLEINSHNLFLKAPTKNMKMAGPPGCTPRFGYDHENFIVTNVIKNSPASLTGVKVGDTILAIDSEASEVNFGTKAFQNRLLIYKNRTAVPIKFKRGDKVLRKTIKAKIMCNH